MKRVAIAAVAVVFAACTMKVPSNDSGYDGNGASARTGRLVFDTIRARSLVHNLVGDSGTREVVVYLPPGYDQNRGKRYPTVYVLHGARLSNKAWLGGGAYRDSARGGQPLSVPEIMDSLVAARAVRPMILVFPDMRDRYDGSWYANSAVIGNWEDYISSELIGYVDSRYQTVRNARARGIVGHSLGGFGAIRTAMRHPDVFSAVFALSPCCLAFTGELGLESPEWVRTLALGTRHDPLAFKNDPPPFRWAFYTASLAFTPDPKSPPLHVRWPVNIRCDTLVRVEPIASEWLANAPVPMARAHSGQLRRLRAIAFATGTAEPLPHISQQARAFSDTLAAMGIPHSYDVFEGGHEDQIAAWMRTRVLPFFSTNLTN